MYSKEFPELKTDQLLLRQFTDSDLKNIFEGLSDPDVNRFYGVSYKTLDDTKKQLEYFRELEQNGTGIWWAICNRQSLAFYGGGGFNNLSSVHRKAEIGFWVLRKFWGQGIMSEALPLICRYGFEELRLHRIEGVVETANLICKHSIVKLGFTHEGTHRDAERKNGKYISLDVFALINPSDES